MGEQHALPAIEPVDLEKSFLVRRRADVLLPFGGLDEDWYRARYHDAGFFGGSAVEHFLLFGAAFGRGIHRDIPRLSMAPELETALFRTPTISYCIAVMNRPDDVRGTLRANLDENRVFGEKVEFVLVFLDDDSAFHAWVREEFAAELRAGYLRVIEDPPLAIWHFGRAKNSHRRFASGKVFSSLDGDNFVTRHETQQLLEIFDRFGPDFVFHHFSGNWGDGTSGRVSAGMRFYEEVGYDETFLPRQYDEIDFILTTLRRHPNTPLLRLGGDNHGLSSTRSKNFIRKSAANLKVVEVEPVERRAPLNPKDGGYVDEDRLLGTMQTFNQFMCFVKNAPTASVRTDYIKMIHKARQALIDDVPRENIMKMVFNRNDLLPNDFSLGPHDVCAFGCVKNDDVFLPDLYRHYKSIGVRYLFLVDDGSTSPIKEILPFDDVIVAQPAAGNFVTSKTLWLEALMGGIPGDGHWVLTIDADEFVDLPAPYTSLPALTKHLTEEGLDFAPGLLIDMVPGDFDADFESRLSAEGFQHVLDHFACVDGPPTESYLSAPSLQWAFGAFASIPWSLDARYHAFGTLDTLRKIPLFRTRPGRHLNQGFHTLHYTDGTADPGTEIWERDILLPIRHFKLLKLFSEAERLRMAAQVEAPSQSQYHERTTDNIRRIFGDGSLSQVERLMSLPRRAYVDGVLNVVRPPTAREVERRVEPAAVEAMPSARG